MTIQVRGQSAGGRQWKNCVLGLTNGQLRSESSARKSISAQRTSSLPRKLARALATPENVQCIFFGVATALKCPAESAARLRVSEKQFVLDHAVMMKNEPWFRHLKPEDWCQHLGVITDAGNAVEGIKGVVTGNNRAHFTLPLVQTGTRCIAGYVHAAYSPEEQELSIAHVKVDEEHMGLGLGGMLIDAAEEHSESIGWKCRNTALSVLKANARARRCYEKAGFRVASGSAASWGKKTLHVWSEWQKLRKVHKSALKTSVKT
mmetsp:Transcript_78503/g.129879  ORF Transcript_78503/g.129879 Transcript_78503/m.129879 type:complete len:262 (+) Transcript_78503:204-989(+)